MTEKIVTIAVIKLGCLGSSILLEVMPDERADREDISVRAFTSGAKLDEESAVEVTDSAIGINPDFVMLVSPNAALPGPKSSRKKLHEAGIPTLSVTDGPGKKAFYKKNEEGKKELRLLDKQGFITIPADAMIGARREFLDTTEMGLFNVDVLNVLLATGVIRLIQKHIDDAIESIKKGEEPDFPKVSVSAAKAVDAGGFSNPYAIAKAYAALKIAEAVADLTTKACFKEQDRSKYIPMVTAAHEMMRSAARLADEAREIEKSQDSVLRTSHYKDGSTRKKTKLMEEDK